MADEIIQYFNQDFIVIRKPRRRTLSVKLSFEGQNKIYAHNSLPQKVIFEFLLSKKNWIEQKLTSLNELKKKAHHPQFKEAELFPFLGEMKYFSFTNYKSKKIKFQIEDGFLSCSVPINDIMDEKKLNKALIQFYKKEAQLFLIDRCMILSEQLILNPSKIKIQTANRRWGSCNSLGVINLNWKLMMFPPSLIDYVIIHELCHLKYLNHSKNFWSLVESHYPLYREAQDYFKSEGHSLSGFL